MVTENSDNIDEVVEETAKKTKAKKAIKKTATRKA